MKRCFKYLFLVLFFSVMLDVNASVKCSEGKPGDTVNCVINNAGHGGSVSNIEVDKGLTFVSCDVCSDGSYTIESNKDANFKFKIADNITESKTLSATFGGETAKIKVVVSEEETEETDEESDATIYSVTLVPGNGQSNKTKTCTVNSLNTTCSITLDEIDNPNFTGWGKEKTCTEGAKGSVKVNKNITYYACYKNVESTDNDEEENNDNTQNVSTNILLKTLIVKNGEENVDLGFSIRKFEYNITIPTNVESLEVIPTAQDEGVKIEVVGNNELKNAKNVITIKLTSEDGKYNNYIINVLKSEEASKPLLSSLTVGTYNIQFSPERFSYNLKIDNKITSLIIDAVPEKDSYEKTVTGNSNLKDGSQIKIVVTNSETKQESTYVINIEKGSNKLFLYIGISVVVLIILIILLIVVVKKGKKSNTNNSTNNKGVSKNIKGQTVNNKNNIPEVISNVPVTPVVPVAPNVSNNEVKNVDIETLDL